MKIITPGKPRKAKEITTQCPQCGCKFSLDANTEAVLSEEPHHRTSKRPVLSIKCPQRGCEQIMNLALP